MGWVKGVQEKGVKRQVCGMGEGGAREGGKQTGVWDG